MAQVYDAAGRLEAAYARAGFVLVRVVIPPQTIEQDGELRIEIVDGTIEAIDSDGVPSKVRGFVRAHLLPLVGRPHLGLTELDQRLTLAGSAAGLELRSALKAGLGPGTIGANSRFTYNSSSQTNNGPALNGLQGADSFTITGIAAGTVAGSFNDRLGLTANGGTLASNYDVHITNGSLVIDRAPLTITGGSRRTTYDGSAQSNGYTITAGQLYGSDRLTGVAGLASATNAGTFVDSLANATGSGLGNYDITYVNGSLVIDRAPLTVTARDAVVAYSGVPWSGGAGFDIAGLVQADTLESITGSLTWGGDSQGAVAVGRYMISLGGLSNPNYTIAWNPGSLTVKIPALYSSIDSFTGHQRALMAANSNGQPAVVPEGSPLITLVECLQLHCLFRAQKLPQTLYRQVKLSVRADMPR